MSAEKRRVEMKVRQLRAMCLLSCSLGADLRKDLERDLARIPEMHKKELLQLEKRADATVAEIGRRLGLRKTPEECLAYVDEMEQAPGEMPWLRKRGIEDEWFSNLADVLPKGNLYPPHTRFGIDVKGYMPAGLEFRLLEASLFESAALLWNDTAASEVPDRDLGAMGDSKIPWKRHEELKRSAVRGVFALLEGYLNGIALDVELTTDLTTLSVNARELILEHNDDGKARFKTLREKTFSYPRIALGLEHSPVQETNEHVKWILAHERELRDAIVHPTPRAEDGAPIREQVYYDTDFAVVRDLVDQTTGLIRYVDTLLNGRFGRVELWLRDRGPDGLFPSETFH
jgi:hypothetical protein